MAPTINTDQIIADAREELKTSATRRDQIDKRIAELSVLLRTLVRFMPDESHRRQLLQEIEESKRKSPSLSEAISSLLQPNDKGMTSNQLRDALEQGGFDLSEYSQPLGAIMATLSRLVEQDKVTRYQGDDRNVIFKWITGTVSPLPPTIRRNVIRKI